MALGNLKKYIQKFREARALSTWGRGGAGSKAEADAIKALRDGIIGDVLKLIKQHKAQAAKRDYIPPGVLLADLAEAIEKLKE